MQPVGVAAYGNAGMGKGVKVKPPLVMSEAEAESVMQVFEEVTRIAS
jgi:4-aminobutyrate aminotransferase-like enzyme